MILTKHPDTGYYTQFVVDGRAAGGLINVHSPRDCADRDIGCAIHDRASDHALKDAPLNWREDAGKLERICSHGIGHDDYDSAQWTKFAFPDAQYVGVHGCDGCCYTPSPGNIVVELTAEDEAVAQQKRPEMFD